MPAAERVMGALQRGAGLIEVAIALLVLSIGALGLGSMQLTARRLGFEALQRTEAAALANDLFERVRVNRESLATYASRGLGTGVDGMLATPEVDCGNARCSASQLQAWDLWQWQRALAGANSVASAGGLVHALACIAITGQRVTVGIAWRQMGSQAVPNLDAHCMPGAENDGIQWLRMTSWVGER